MSAAAADPGRAGAAMTIPCMLVLGTHEFPGQCLIGVMQTNGNSSLVPEDIT